MPGSIITLTVTDSAGGPILDVSQSPEIAALITAWTTYSTNPPTPASPLATSVGALVTAYQTASATMPTVTVGTVTGTSDKPLVQLATIETQVGAVENALLQYEVQGGDHTNDILYAPTATLIEVLPSLRTSAQFTVDYPTSEGGTLAPTAVQQPVAVTEPVVGVLANQSRRTDGARDGQNPQHAPFYYARANACTYPSKD